MSVHVGTDLIEIERIRRALARYERFRERCFTAAERAYCDSRRHPAQSYAGRLAERAAALGVGSVVLSMTHSRELAQAVAVASDG